MEIRTRLAPSPTGFFHIGNARAGIFNYLFTKKNNGKFILRIEDTDEARSKKEYEEDAKEALAWLGIEWDEFSRQSDRKAIYEGYIKKLLGNGSAYVIKEEMLEVIRLKNPGKVVSFKDNIRGEISVDTADLGDFVIAKDEKSPLYHLAVVIDDAEMKISHVIRGEDHISNTPRQILIQEALGFTRPEYAHLPLILDKDRSKLSKRAGGEALSDYKKMGYPPEAMFNFLALLGWHPKDDREILKKEELINEFSIERVQKGGAVLDTEQLDWISREYIKKMTDGEYMKYAKAYVNEKWAPLFRDRISKFTDLEAEAKFLTTLEEYDPSLLVWKNSTKEDTQRHLKKLCEIISSDGDIMAYGEAEGKGNVLWPLRVALSGMKNSPGPLEILEALGKQEALKRIQYAISKI